MTRHTLGFGSGDLFPMDEAPKLPVEKEHLPIDDVPLAPKGISPSEYASQLAERKGIKKLKEGSEAHKDIGYTH